MDLNNSSFGFSRGAGVRGVMVVTVRNPVFAALFLVLAFFTSAGLWLLLEAEFSRSHWCWCMSVQ